MTSPDAGLRSCKITRCSVCGEVAALLIVGGPDSQKDAICPRCRTKLDRKKMIASKDQRLEEVYSCITLEEAEGLYIKHVIDGHDFNRTELSLALGITRATLLVKLKKYDLG